MLPPRSRFDHTTAVGAASILAYAVWYWSCGHEGAEITSEVLLASLRLMLACGALTVIGVMVLVVVRAGGVLASLPGLSRLVCGLVVGQLACMVWVLLRSGVSGVGFLLFERQVPLSRLEVGATIIGLAWLALRSVRKESLLGATERLRVSFGDIGCFVVLLACALVPLGVRELPRTLALSSDPDQHAFWAAQVARLGLVPWDQGILGIGPFDYPAGFAVLNAVWMVFSGLSAVEVVTVQPMVQLLCGVLLCVALAPLALAPLAAHGDRQEGSNTVLSTNALSLLASLVALLGYWFVLPYGMHNERYHGSGTARLATSMLSAVVVLAWVIFTRRDFGTRALRAQGSGIIVLVSFVTSALIASFNPMSAVMPGLLSVASAGSYLLSFSGSRLRALGYTAGAAGLGLLVLACDPYFAARGAKALGAAMSAFSATQSPTIPGGAALSVGAPSVSIWEWLAPGTAVRLLFGGLYKPEQLHWAVVAGAGLAWLLWCVHARGIALRYAIVVVAALGALFVNSGISAAGDVSLPLYLVQPYIAQGVWEFGVVLGWLLFAVGWRLWVRVVGFSGARGRIVALSAGILGLACLVPTHSIAGNSGEFKLTPRVGYCGSFGCATSGDLAALSFLGQLGTDVLRRYPNLTFESAPKVLLLGHPDIHGVERWVFPHGASRIAPMWSPLPVAFFYGRGSPLWSYENYVARVCHQFDREWMRQHNIRYLFIPSSNPGCLRGRERVLAESTVLFERDGAKVVALF